MTPTPTADPAALAAELIAAPSVTPENAGCQEVLSRRLAAGGFTIFDLTRHGIRNFYARRGTGHPVVCFAGHTDVVPPGPLEDWRFDPFRPTLADDCLYGRGAADMKGALAAMVCAAERFIQKHPATRGSIAFLITGDEEGDALHGTAPMVEWLRERGELPDFCVVGEPSSERKVADTVKVGRRGSVTGMLTIHGTQGHVAYPQRADNPAHRAFPALAALAEHVFDRGNEVFEPTRLQITEVQTEGGAVNVIPGKLRVRFNLRFSTASTPESIDRDVTAILARHGLRYELKWQVSAQPFLTTQGPLIQALSDAVRQVTGTVPALSTSGGTSDARFIAPLGVQVAELGLINATIHKVNEQVPLADLTTLTDIYEAVLERLTGGR